MSGKFHVKILAMNHATASNPDPRKRRTREDLLAAFFSLVLERRYHEIRLADVLAASGVGRSTFYEHFKNKDDLLFASLPGPFSILAGMARSESSAQQVQGILEHFWDNRALARSLFNGAALRVIKKALAAQVESRLDRDCRSRLRIPVRLAAISLTEGMFSPIVAWLSGEARCNASDLAITLCDSTAAAVRAMQLSAVPTESPAGESLTMRRITPMLPVKNMARSVEFYRQLGFEIEQRNDHWRWARLTLDGCSLMVDESINTNAKAARLGVLYFYPGDIAVFHRRARQSGLDLPPLESTFYGMTEFRIEDLDGNRLWFGKEEEGGSS